MITIDEAMHIGLGAILNEVRHRAGNKPVYVTLDIDSIDPAFAPGTGTPEVGGFSSYQMLQMLRGLKGLNLIGFDLVEVSPPFDHSNITAILAANLIFEFLSLIAVRKAEAAPRSTVARSEDILPPIASDQPVDKHG